MQVPCVLQIFQHVPFVCAGELQDTALPRGIERKFQGQGEAARFGFPEFPECFVPVLERSKDGAEALQSPNSTPSSAQLLPRAFQGSFHSFLWSWGSSFYFFIFFFGTKQDPSLQTLAGGQGWVFFPKKSLLPLRVTAAAGAPQGS